MVEANYLDRPEGSAPLTHVFDSNGVRALGRLDQLTWERVLAAWKTRKLTTGWIPWVVREVVGTNFIGDDGDVVSQPLVEEIVRSVRRMDQLADGDVLPGFEQLIRYSLFEFSTASGGPSADGGR